MADTNDKTKLNTETAVTAANAGSSDAAGGTAGAKAAGAKAKGAKKAGAKAKSARINVAGTSRAGKSSGTRTAATGKSTGANTADTSGSNDTDKRKYAVRRALVLIGAILVFIVVALWVVFRSPLFAIKEIEVEPLAHYTEEEIAGYLSEYIGSNGFRTVMSNSSLHQTKSLFSMELVDVEQRILFDCPYLESVTVKYRPRGTLAVSAVERKASFLTEYYDTYLMCDVHGVVLETFTREDLPEGVPLVKGITPEGFKLGRSISDGKNTNIDTAIKLCGLLSQLGMEGYIDIADVSDYNNIYLFCAPSLTIKIGSSVNVGVRLSLLKSAMDDGLNGNADGTLTITDGKRATFVKNGERDD